ncbi:MAG: ABC transporter ATP-binding protein [Crenarchaeota archaeon]|nr:ABC transporter ATP-binding protein [Thermoproteota archaeon]
MPEPILHVQDLKKYFPVERSLIDRLLGKSRLYVKAVDDVSFEVYENEIFGIVGESGCGKSTLGRLIIGLIRPTSGSIIYRSSLLKRTVDIAKLREKELRVLRRELQIIFQDPYSALNPKMKIGDFIGHPLEIHGIAKGEEKRELVMKIMEKVGLVPPEEYYDRYPRELSGGQRQRVVIARALILNPRLIVADEPTSNLDVSIQARIIALLLRLRDEMKLTYIFITHSIALAQNICNRIAVMYLGKIVELGDSQAIIDEPLHPYTRLLMSSVIDPDTCKLPRVREVSEPPSPIGEIKGCRFASRCPEKLDICLKEEPPLVEVYLGHYVRCWHYVRR